MTRYIYETRKNCSECGRDVDAIRSTDVNGLRFSRHFSPKQGSFCVTSLELVVPKAVPVE